MSRTWVGRGQKVLGRGTVGTPQGDPQGGIRKACGGTSSAGRML